MEKLVKKKKKKPVVYEKPAKRKPIPKGEKIYKAKPKDTSKPPHETPVGYKWGKNKSGKYDWIKKKRN